ncbi:MAG: bifunctional riboflavin kinase/FAD synthetase [Ferruginibacter sp.]
MNIYTSIEDIPNLHHPVITTGSFDGVHLGHQQILAAMCELAQQIHGTTVLITFDPHPRKLLNPTEQSLFLLSSFSEKINLLEKAGIDHLVVLPFTNEIAQMSANKYVEDFLMAVFKPHTLFAGYDHRFGKNRTGDIQLLKNYAEAGHFKVIDISKQLCDNLAISSSAIRKAITLGDMEQANSLLGYRYSITGIVIKGDGIGHTIGFPTANISPLQADKHIPGDGVYAVMVYLENERPHPGVMNIGYRPTLSGSDRRLEVHLLGFDTSIYGLELTVQFHHKLRNEQTFRDLNALKTQIKLDCEKATLLLSYKNE